MGKLVISMLLALVLLVAPVLARDETLIDGKFESSGFGGPVLKLTQLNDELGLMVGGRGGWIINHTFVIGGGGYGLANKIEAKKTSSNTTLYLEMGYGGLEFEYINASSKLIHFSIYTLIGGGGVGYSDRDSHTAFDEKLDQDSFFVLEPAVNAMLNVTQNFRMGIGVGYRFISGADSNGIGDSDLSWPSATLTFKFGKF